MKNSLRSYLPVLDVPREVCCLPLDRPLVLLLDCLSFSLLLEATVLALCLERVVRVAVVLP